MHSERQEQVANDAKLATLKLIDCTNIMGFDDAIVAGVAEAIRGEHRTLQASFWRVIFAVAEQYKDAPHDLRNKAAVEACGIVSESLKDKAIPFI